MVKVRVGLVRMVWNGDGEGGIDGGIDSGVDEDGVEW